MEDDMNWIYHVSQILFLSLATIMTLWLYMESQLPRQRSKKRVRY